MRSGLPGKCWLQPLKETRRARSALRKASSGSVLVERTFRIRSETPFLTRFFIFVTPLTFSGRGGKRTWLVVIKMDRDFV